MFKGLTIWQKVQGSLILIMMLLLILGSNRLDKKNYAEINKTVNSVYKDRVVVQGLIYELNNIFHQKEIRLLQGDAPATNAAENEKVHQLLADFAATELTVKESKLLVELTGQFDELKKLEQNRAQATDDNRKAATMAAVTMLNSIEENLDGLTEVQLDQGSRLTIFSQKSMDMISLLSNLEVAFMILIGVLILITIFYPTKREEQVLPQV